MYGVVKVAMPPYKSIQCKATVARGNRQCKRRTIARSPYCYSHTESKLGVQVKKSKIRGAGKGLFATRDIKKGARILEYTGVRTTTLPPGHEKNDYITEVKVGDVTEYIDAEDPTKSSVMRYANDCRRKNKDCTSNNSKFYKYRKPLPLGRSRRDGVVNRNKTKVYVKSTRAIKKGSEIYLGYGREYWRGP
jgi:uncharacterized protein